MGEDGKRCLLELVEDGRRWEKMPAGVGRQLDGKMAEDACWTGTRDGGRCLLELADSWTCGKMDEDVCWTWSFRQLDGREDG